MTNTTTSFTYNPGGLGDVTCYLFTSEDYLNVYATVELGSYTAFDTEAYCILTLKRYDGGYWNTIDTKRGFAKSSGQNLNVTFNNIAKRTLAMRVILDLYTDSGYTDKVKTVYGNQWIR